MTLARIYTSGNVRRYHTNPTMAALGQTNADHHGRCVQLLLALHPEPSVELVRAVAHHDVAERWVGDLPAPFKQQAPDLAKAHADVEAARLCDVLGAEPALTAADAEWLRLVDRLEAYAYMRTHAPWEADRDGWPDARAALEDMAWRLGTAPGVIDFLRDLDARNY